MMNVRAIRAFYRTMVWVPVALPLAVIALAGLTGMSLSRGPLVIELMAYSLLYGGIPYAVLAAWATWRIGRLDEPGIRRLMFRAPLLFAAVYIPVASMVGIVAGGAGPWTIVGLLGAAVIVALGYCYVGLTLGLRRLVGASDGGVTPSVSRLSGTRSG